MMHQRGWNQELADFAATLWANGFSASIIADELGTKFGAELSRNAILGKIHRLGLSERIVTEHQAKKPIPGPRKKVQPPTVTYGLTATEANSVPYLDAQDHHCKFQYGELGPETSIYDLRSCSAHALSGSVYCEHHHNICTSPLKRR